MSLGEKKKRFHEVSQREMGRVEDGPGTLGLGKII